MTTVVPAGSSEPPPNAGLPFAPKPTVQWSVQPRYVQWADAWKDRIDTTKLWDAETYSPTYVHPTEVGVDVDVCLSEDDRTLSKNGQPTGWVYTFYPTGGGFGLVRRSCLDLFVYPLDLPTAFKVVVTHPDGTFAPSQTLATIAPKDLLVVALGDSYGAGEGAPDVPHPVTPTWVDRRCHRSLNSGLAKAAEYLEAADPHTSVTFISFACSGANISREAGPASDALDPYSVIEPSKSMGVGILGPYRGVDPMDTGFGPLPAQVNQLRTALRLPDNPGEMREVDAMLVSAGGNDAGFSLIAATCVLYGPVPFLFDDCREHEVTSGVFGVDTQSLEDRFATDVAELPGYFVDFKAALTARGIVPGEVYVTEYPDSTMRSTTTTCAAMLADTLDLNLDLFALLATAAASDVVALAVELGGPFMILVLAVVHMIPSALLGYLLVWPLVESMMMDAGEVAWAHSVVAPTINAKAKQGTLANGWTFVEGISSRFAGHGYCTADRWVATSTDSTANQGPLPPVGFPGLRMSTTGTLHPNATGYLAYRDALGPAMAADLLDGPVAFPDAYATIEGGAFQTPPPGVLANDSSIGGAIVTTVTGPAHGSFGWTGGGGFLYSPTPGFVGNDEVTYRVETPLGISESVITIDVTFVDDPPVVVDDDARTRLGRAVVVDVLANDTDPEGLDLGIWKVGSPTAGRTSITADGKIRYEPDGDSLGVQTFHYWAFDGPNIETAMVTVIVRRPRCTIIGTSGPDTLTGTPGPDVICGLGGDDVLEGLGGRDVIFGGPGADVLSGGPGNDLLLGEGGPDVLGGGGGDNEMFGGTGNDTIVGGPAADIVAGGPGRDGIDGLGGDDYLSGGPGRDVASGGPGHDVLLGGDGNDLLRGDGGGDLLHGDDGNDRLVGGGGPDELWGGDGVDRLLCGTGVDGYHDRDEPTVILACEVAL